MTKALKISAFLMLLAGVASGQTFADTSKIVAFDPVKTYFITGSALKSYITSGGIVATDIIWDAAGDIVQGTGANTAARLALGTASQQLRVNAGATALEYFTPSAGSGDIINGGNTTGATVVIGTNDANALQFETNNVTRANITGGASTGGAVTLTDVTSNTSTVEDAVTIQTNSSGTAAAGFGGAILFNGESSTTDNQNMARISSLWTTATHASRASALTFSTLTAAGSLTERMRIDGAGNVGIGGSPTYLLDLLSNYNTSAPTFRTGTFLMQPYALNNGFIADNAYYNGSSWTRLTTGYATGFQFYNGQLQLFNQASGSGTFTQNVQMKIDYNNNFAFGSNISGAINDFTGATFIHTSSGRTGLGITAPTANLHIVQTAAATTARTGIIYTGAVNTNQTLSTEIPAVTFTTAGRQWATGALTTQREVLITQPTYSFVGSSTITNAATLGIAGAPIKSTNATITNTHGILVQAGAVSTATNSYGLSVNAQTGATNNYAAQFIGGNVGIGTAAPAQPLDVTGNAIVAGNLASTRNTASLGSGATTLAITRNVVTVDGHASGNTLATITGGLSGQILTLIFVDSDVTITDDASATADTVNLSAAFTSTANDTITLVFDGTSWFETDRSVN